jgi:hypothetical protein
MSDRKALAREIAARTKPRFIEIKPEPRRKVSRPSSRRFVEIPRERRSGVPFTARRPDRSQPIFSIGESSREIEPAVIVSGVA